MFGFISKKKLYEELNMIYQLNNPKKAYSNVGWHFNCGCDSVCNYLCGKFNLPKLKEPKKDDEIIERSEDEQI